MLQCTLVCTLRRPSMIESAVLCMARIVNQAHSPRRGTSLYELHQNLRGMRNRVIEVNIAFCYGSICVRDLRDT
jgi:hypothetical protein